MTAPFDRAAAIARVGFLMPGLTDDGLRWLLARATCAAVTMSRDLTPATLAAEQRAREGRTFGGPKLTAPCEWCKAAEGEIHSALCRVRAVRQVLPGETLADACRREVAAERVPTVAECFARAEAAGTLVAKGCSRCAGDGYPACACEYEKR